MKKLVIAAFTAIVAVMMLTGCTKGAGTTASIVGTWETYSATTNYLDANGNPVSLRDVALAMMKENGQDIPDEILALMDDVVNQMVKDLEKNQTMVFDDKNKARVEFTSDGKMNGYEKEGSEWKAAGSGTYKYEGNKLTMTTTGLDAFSGTATVIKLDASNLVIRVEMTEMIDDFKSAEPTASDIDFDILTDITLNRVK